ncbi:MAG TPA: tetratricopeptide repeat protein [Myxococcaceae bacterium]|nr:tetratricopeptide repeat protein [Myxococcaceae bacterium]
MRVTCPSCQTAYNIDERRIPPGGAKLKCSTCQTLIPLRPPEAAPPEPASVGVRFNEGAVPLPGLGLGASGPSAGGLPQITARPPEPPPAAQSLTTGAIPLPPARAPTPAGIPSIKATPPVPPPRRADRTTVAPGGAVELPAPSTPPRTGPGVAPPPSVFAPPPPPPLVPPDSPLPGFEEAGFDDAALSDSGAQSEDPEDGSYGAEALHADTPAEGPEPVTPPQATATQAHAHEDEEPWDPGTSPDFGTIDLGGDDANATALPIPADDPLPAGDEVAWTEPPPAAPDMLDLSNLPQTRVLKELDGGPAADPLEFDPTRPSPEDLEADLSSPLPASVRPAEDGLEVLGFLDEAAKEIRPRAGRITRYHVRRRSGKVFGPFEPGVIVKMLEDGQLLGSEEVSLDGDAWTGMAAVPTFAQAMQRLVSAPAQAHAAPPKPAAAPAAAPPKLDLDQLAQAYGGRMAMVSMVDGEAQARRRKRWLMLAAAALGVLALIGAGASLHLTRYGAFGLRWLFPAHVSASSTEGKTFAEAKAGLAEDTWPGLRKARAQLEGLLSRREYPEVRAVWAQSVFFEQRRWGTADPAQLAQATAALEDLKILPKGNTERLKAEIGQALAGKQPDVALGLIRAAKLDAEGPLLEAEALVQKGQTTEAATVLDGAVKAAPSGAGWHALGLAHLKLKKPDKAQADFEAALKAAPAHLSSSLELAQLALGRKEPAGALKTLEPALAEPKALAPPERARGLALSGAALLLQGKPADAVAGLEEAVRVDPKSVFAKGTLARAYSALKQDEKALPLWKAAVTGEPDNPVWADGQVQSLAALKKSEEALSAATKARAAFPKDLTTALVVARAQELLDRSSDAEASYRAATQLDPTDLDAALGLARLYLRQRRPTDARAALAGVTEKQPQNARLRLGLGELALATGELSTAQSEFERATSLAPEMAEAWVARARLALERRAWKEARAHVEKALSLDPDVAEGRLVHGLALWKLGELQEAAKELEAARSAGPNHRLEVALGAVRFEQGDLEAAASLLQEVLKAEPGNPEANFWMARVHAKKGDYSLAQESIRAALDRAPTRAAYHNELGHILRDAGKSPEAVEAWKQAVKLDPAYADAWESMGQAYLDAGRYKDAIAAFEAALKADPGRVRVQGLIGDAQFQSGKWKEAAGSYSAGLKADPSLTGLYYRLGRAYSELGQYDKAIGFYQRGLQNKPDDAQAWYHLGYALKEKGKKREAVAAFQNYLAKAPGAKDKKDIEDEIYYLSR